MKINVWLYSLALLLRNLIVIKAICLFFLKKLAEVLHLPHAQMLFFEISYDRVTKLQKVYFRNSSVSISAAACQKLDFTNNTGYLTQKYCLFTTTAPEVKLDLAGQMSLRNAGKLAWNAGIQHSKMLLR